MPVEIQTDMSRHCVIDNSLKKKIATNGNCSQFRRYYFMQQLLQPSDISVLL